MKLVTVLAGILFLCSCSTFHFPAVHKITIQQGNVVTQAMMDKLKPGMTKSQVLFVMGHPLVKDPLNPSRWIYYYSIKIGSRPVIHRVLKLHFIDDRLSYFDGDFMPTINKNAVLKAMEAKKKHPAKS